MPKTHKIEFMQIDFPDVLSARTRFKPSLKRKSVLKRSSPATTRIRKRDSCMVIASLFPTSD